MKVRKLRLQSYRNHRDSTLDMGDAKFIIVRGANASGKSSIAQALSMNLTPSTMGLDPQGRGFAGKIMNGESKGIITAEIQGQHTLENTVTLHVSATGRTQAVKCLDDPDDKRIVTGFENYLARYKDALGIALNTDLFMAQGEKEQKALLAKLVLPSRYEFPRDKQVAVCEALGDANRINFDGEPFAVIERAYKLLYKERETVNREVKDFVVPEPLEGPKGADSETLQKKLDATKTMRQALLTEKDAAVKKAHEVEVQRLTLANKIETMLAEVQRDNDRILEYGQHVLPDAKLKEVIALSKNNEQFSQLSTGHTEWLTKIREATKELADAQKAVGTAQGFCQACNQPITKAHAEKVVKDAEERLKIAQETDEEIAADLNALGDVGAALAALDKHNTSLAKKIDLEAELAEKVRKGTEVRAELNALPEKVDAGAPFAEQLTQIDVEFSRLAEQLRPVIAAEERAKEIESRKGQLAKLQKKAEAINTLVKYFDKDGIKAKLIAEYIGGFEAKLNAVLSVWGYQASLSNDLANFNVKTPRGYIGPVGEISGAEAHMFKAAFQCAVSIAAGIGVVVVDEIEELGEDIRQPLYRTIYGLIQDGSLEQAILIGWSVDKDVPSPKAPGSLYYFVTDGMVEKLG